MRKIKISLAVIVVGAIIFFVLRSFVNTGKVGAIQQSGNAFIDKIQQKISELKIKPENKFCKEFYAQVVYELDDYHRYKY